MRIVITGASGNVGTALLRRLVRTGDHELAGIVRRPPEPVGIYSSVQWHALDVADSNATSELKKLFAGADAVVHLAWGFQPTRNVEYLRSVGVRGTTAVLDAADACELDQLVHMSSVGTYAAGRYGQRVDESWSTSGIESSPYSRHKSAAEAVLDGYQQSLGTNAIPIARLRPGFILQRIAASGLMRYALPAYLPMQIVPLLPVLPIDRRLCIPIVHTEDVADAIARVVERRATGAFNLAAEPPVGRDDVAAALGARRLHVPAEVLGRLVDIGWRLRLQPIDRGWLDMAFAVPLLDCGRANAELEWKPRWSSTEALADLLDGIAAQAHADSAPLRGRSVIELLRKDLTDGQISSRHLP
ncbi:NAD-dependent epimerase/dehydratase family protein [Mycobacterium sp. URHB0021]